MPGKPETNYLDRYPNPTESARTIVPMVMDLLGTPEAVVDLGGGIGAWGEVFRQCGTKNYVCIDDPSISPAELRIPPEDFVGHDLAKSLPPPIRSALSVSLEFAEHVPAELSSAIVSFLVRSAPLVLFSASMPGQPGRNHVNEQPPLYWKSLFAEHGYHQLDLIRPRIIERREIPYWYRQNLFVYASPEEVVRLSPLAQPFREIPDDFELVHRRVLDIYRTKPSSPGLLAWMMRLPEALTTTLRKRVITLAGPGGRK